jgi:hypothetical protein
MYELSELKFVRKAQTGSCPPSDGKASNPVETEPFVGQVGPSIAPMFLLAFVLGHGGRNHHFICDVQL